MARVFRWLFNIAFAMVLIAVGAVALAYYFAARSLPDYTDQLQIAGITGEIEIVRDTANVPHIFATTDADAYFGLGYAHAQDRMWQMIMMRRTVQGRLSELFGERTLPVDTLMRRLDLDGAALASEDVQDAETTAALRAYADGVNAWLREINAGARGRGAPEMWLFTPAISPWEPADSLAILKLLALQGSTHLEQEVLRARASLVLGDDRIDDILPDAPGRGVSALPPYQALIPALPTQNLPQATARYADLSPVAPRALGGASNAWAAGITRSAAGGTLLANDPHNMLTAPSQWYLARLQLADGGVIGATVPGMPIVLSGRSATLGWGVTASFLDDLDVYIEEVNPQNTDQYRTEDGWADFEQRPSVINIEGQPGITIRLQWTRNGPVLPPDQYALGTIRPPGHVTAINWTALSREDTSMSSLRAIMTSADAADAMEASRTYIAPSFNLTLADRTRIGMRLIGAMPARDADHMSEGRLPTLGYLPQNLWEGMLPQDDNPMAMAPDGDLIGNTNNRVIRRPFPRHVSHHWGDTQRILRWRFLMQGRGVHTRESFIEAQLDTVSPTARTLLPLIGADLWFTGEAAAEGTSERQRQTALSLLGDWNGEMGEHLPEPLIYAAWVHALQDRLLRDELGALSSEFTHVEPLFIARVFTDRNGAAQWCDVIQSAPVETCSDLARLALDDAIVWLSETYSDDLESLRWGDAHEATHDHAVLRDTPVLNWVVNIRQSTSGGDHTLNRGVTRGGDGPAPFHNVHAAGYRGVYDFADPDSSLFVISTGQSGHPLSRHYDDLGDLWRRGEYVPMSLDPGLARAGAVGVTVLTPAVP